MPARTLVAAAAFAAAVAVYALVRRDRRRLCGRVAAERLMAGSAARDNKALGRELAAFRDRLEVAGLQRAVMQEADLVLSQALAAHAVYGDGSEGGPA